MAAAGSLAHFVLPPGVVAGLVPWWLTGWRVRQPMPAGAWASLKLTGVTLLATGAVVLVQAVVRFVVEGLGTPAPIAPTRRLVVGGPYRYVRNPMYLAVTVVIVGQALAFGQPWLRCTRRRWAPPWPPSPTATRSRSCAASSAGSTRPTGGPCPAGGRAGTRGCRARPTNPPPQGVIAIRTRRVKEDGNLPRLFRPGG